MYTEVVSTVVSVEAPIRVISVCTEAFKVSTEARKLLISLVSCCDFATLDTALWSAT